VIVFTQISIKFKKYNIFTSIEYEQFAILNAVLKMVDIVYEINLLTENHKHEYRKKKPLKIFKIYYISRNIINSVQGYSNIIIS